MKFFWIGHSLVEFKTWRAARRRRRYRRAIRAARRWSAASGLFAALLMLLLFKRVIEGQAARLLNQRQKQTRP
jgi:hypothetical protein